MANLFGTVGADALSGTSGADTISGGPPGNEAADVGDDTLDGGAAGADSIRGWGGDDSLTGSLDPRDDTLRGGDGDDTIGIGGGSAYGDAGDDLIAVVADFAAYLNGGTGADTLIGGARNDELFSAEHLESDTAADSLAGGGGADTLYSGGGVDTLDGGTGFDVAAVDRRSLVLGFRFTPDSAATPTIASDGTVIVNVEGFLLQGGSGNDTLSGLAGYDELYGVDGDDSLIGGSGDYVIGGDGDDTIAMVGGPGAAPYTNYFAYGEAGDDRITIDDFLATAGISGGDGDDTLIAIGLGALRGDDGADLLVAGQLGVSLDGGAGGFADTLLGGVGDDTLFTAGGADRIEGGGGFDRLYINQEGQTEGLTLRLGLVGTVSTASNGMTINGVDAIDVRGSYGKDHYAGRKGADQIYGDGGRDLLQGRAGDDGLSGGRGDDTLIGGAGSDRLFGDIGDDVFRWNALDPDDADTVFSFKAGEDRLEFHADALGGLLGAGGLEAGDFALNVATNAGPQFIYRTATSLLLWDADGTGAGAAIAIVAFLSRTPAISATDIFIIA